ncbi:unnamed protein product [Ceratitis capitata]|uniref:(Mediterranean fruit fly) hypothetical protein n=1 Tax=Ceratitis capitata TaxID=7213 RepID=A0A811UCR9_CERCA|nr:unnamed protein product [Ceratitis capitata]
MCRYLAHCTCNKSNKYAYAYIHTYIRALEFKKEITRNCDFYANANLNHSRAHAHLYNNKNNNNNNSTLAYVQCRHSKKQDQIDMTYKYECTYTNNKKCININVQPTSVKQCQEQTKYPTNQTRKLLALFFCSCCCLFAIY